MSATWYTDQVNEGMPAQPQMHTTGPALAGRDFLYYWRHFRLPLLVVFVIAGVLYAFEQPMLYVIFAELLYLLFVSWFMIKLQRGTQAQVIIMGTISGLTLGLLLSLFKLFWFWKLYLFFNIVTETLVTGLAGLLAGAALYPILHRQTIIAKSILPDRDHPVIQRDTSVAASQTHQPKGGEQHDSQNHS